MRSQCMMASAVALLIVLHACSSVASAASAASSLPTLAFFDINRTEILSTTVHDATTSFGWRSLFSSRQDPDPSVAVATLAFATPSSGPDNTTFEFLSVPYCQDAPSETAKCDFDGYIAYLLVRFRRHQEANFQAVIWQDAWPTASTQKALTAFKSRLNVTNVVYPSGTGAMRMEDTATCSDITDECYLSAAATYTRSYKKIDPAQFTARFLFRLGEKYSLNSPLRVRLQHSLPHDAEAEVDVVLVLSRMPSVNLLDARWWIECVGGRFALLVLSIVVAFGFLASTREVAALLARRRSGSTAASASALFGSDDNEGPLTFLRRVAAVAASGLRKCVASAAARMGGLNVRLSCVSPWRRWWEQRRRLPTSEDATAEPEREISAVPSAGAAVDEEEEEAGPICRICRCREPFNDLFAPCACNGSSKYVHHHCLEQWREMTTNPEHRRVCAECKTPYTLVRVIVPQSTELVTGSPIIEPAIRHSVATLTFVALTILFAVGGAYGLKGVFFLTTGFDPNVEWSFTQGYHWVLTMYFLLALALNLNIMCPYVKDMQSAELQLVFVFLSLVLLEIPVSYGVSAFLNLFFDRLFTWEVSYGLGLIATALMHLTDIFINFFELLDSFAEEREVVGPRAPVGEEEEERRSV